MPPKNLCPLPGLGANPPGYPIRHLFLIQITHVLGLLLPISPAAHIRSFLERQNQNTNSYHENSHPLSD